MKKLKTIIALASLFGVNSLNAGIYSATGIIKVLSVTDSSIQVVGPALSIVGFTAAGSCHVDGSGLVPVLIKSDEKGKAQYSMALSSYMSGKTINIQVDDTNKDANNYCYLRWIGLDSTIN